MNSSCGSITFTASDFFQDGCLAHQLFKVGTLESYEKECVEDDQVKPNAPYVPRHFCLKPGSDSSSYVPSISRMNKGDPKTCF